MNDGPIGQGWPNFNDVRFWPSLKPFALAKAGGAARIPRADVFALGSVGRDRALFRQADGSFREENVRTLGIDVAAPLTDTITFVGTLAPDFSNVEIDQETIAPQEFRRALNEFRPFFAQGASFLNPNPAPVGGFVAPQNLIFYSPSIGPFDRGMKIEGTHKNDSFGVLSARGYDLTTQSTFDDVAYGFKHALPESHVPVLGGRRARAPQRRRKRRDQRVRCGRTQSQERVHLDGEPRRRARQRAGRHGAQHQRVRRRAQAQLRSERGLG